MKFLARIVTCDQTYLAQQEEISTISALIEYIYVALELESTRT